MLYGWKLLFNFFFQKHFDICPKVPVLCTKKCGVRDIPREKVCFVTLSQTSSGTFVLISLVKSSKTLRFKTKVKRIPRRKKKAILVSA